jgi:hypothetical protein
MYNTYAYLYSFLSIKTFRDFHFSYCTCLNFEMHNLREYKFKGNISSRLYSVLCIKCKSNVLKLHARAFHGGTFLFIYQIRTFDTFQGLLHASAQFEEYFLYIKWRALKKRGTALTLVLQVERKGEPAVQLAIWPSTRLPH